MNRLAAMAAMLIAASFVGACRQSPESPKGFRLPDGDAAAGRETFLALQCHDCHRVDGVELPPPEEKGPVSVLLGGEVSRVKTYGELVTSIINPSHELARGYPAQAVSTDGESLMRTYNDVMTIQQLIDLVAFLQAQYEVVPPRDYYSYYPYTY